MKYFLHDSNAFSDEKITEVFIKFGYEGLGLFYTILEKLASQEKPIKTDILKHQLKVGKKLEKCWLFMEQIDIISSNNGETFNKQLLNFSEKYKIKKEKNTKRILQWRENQEIEKNVTRYERICNASKVKLSKVNESKLKKENTEKAKTFSGDDFIDEIINLFSNQFKNIRGVEYFVPNKGKERQSASKVLGAYKSKYPEAKTEEILTALEKFFISAISQTKDVWLNENMSLPILVTKLNVLNKILNNGIHNEQAVPKRVSAI